MFLGAIPAPNELKQCGDKKRRKKFTQEEDELLKELVEKLGVRKWDQIAQHVPGRTGRQCRDRYRNYLVPGYFNGQWTEEEDNLIRQKFAELGPRWSTMKAYFTNRSANALKNRWNYFVCRQNQESVPSQPLSSPPSIAQSGDDTAEIDIGALGFDDMELSDFRVDGNSFSIFAQDAFFL